MCRWVFTACAVLLTVWRYKRLKTAINACGTVPPGIEPGIKHQRTGKRQGYNLPKWWFLFACSAIRQRRTCTPPASAGIFHGLFLIYPALAAILAQLCFDLSFLCLSGSAHIVPCFRLLSIANNPGAMPGKYGYTVSNKWFPKHLYSVPIFKISALYPVESIGKTPDFLTFPFTLPIWNVFSLWSISKKYVLLFS